MAKLISLAWPESISAAAEAALRPRNQPATLNVSRPTGRVAGSALEAAADGRNPGCDSIPP